MNPKKAMRQFMMHLATAPAGALFEIGTMWDAKEGWRVYQRIGDKGMAMSSKMARSLFAMFQNMALRPEWKDIGPSMQGTYEGLSECADEIDRLNRENIVPAEGLYAMQPWGRA